MVERHAEREAGRVQSPAFGLTFSAARFLTSVATIGWLLFGSEFVAAAPSVFNGAWTQLAPTGTQPPPRRDLGAAYDSQRDRLVALSGNGTTWTLDLTNPTATWTPLATAAYTSSGFERALYDPAADRVVMVNSAMQVLELSSSNPTAWVTLPAAGTPPPARSFFAITHDTFRNRLILYGGGPYTGFFNDIWTLNLSGSPQWLQLQPSGSPPPPTWGPIVVFDPDHDQLIIGTGATDISYTVTSRLYSMNLTGTPAWAALSPGGTPLSPCMLAGAVFDAGLHRLLMFGGYPGGQPEVRALEWSPTLQWTVLAPTGPTPAGRWSSNTFYRPAGPAMVVFAGHNGSDFTDTWSLTSGVTTGPPSILSVSPSGGRVGDAIIINGLRLDDVTEVSFNGVVAPIVSTLFHQLETQVPAGATSGPITVTNPSGTGTSPQDFFVGETPVVSTVDRDSAHVGEQVLLAGLHFSGTTSVRFGGTGGAQFTVVSDTELSAVVDSLATSGPITVTTPAASGVSAFSFFVIADDPRPRLLSVRDVAGDQGGRVMLRWRASDFDQLRYRSITGYRVWRRAPFESGLTAAAAPARGWLVTRAPGSALSDPVVFWESLVELPAAFLSGYAYAAATLQDSTELGNPYTAYFVQALTADPFIFYNSSPDSGYSVDDLAPPTPAPFAVQYGPTTNTLHWRGRALPDLRGYQVHRGSTDTFVPNSSNLVITTDDTTYADIPGLHFYKLAAIDVHGNRSRYAAASPDRPVATLASFLRAERASGRVRVTWFSGGNAGMPANVYRRTVDTDWQLQRAIHADGSGYLNFEDFAVEDQQRYGYRLGVTEPDGEELSLGEGWVDPLVTAFAWIRVPTNPSAGGRVSLSFAIPAGASADVQLFDVAGREVEALELAAGTESTRSAQFGSTTRLRPGVYLVRATLGATVLTRRVVVLD